MAALDLLLDFFVRVPQHGSRYTNVPQWLCLDAHQPQTIAMTQRQ